jgi:hypothetical protein
MMFVNVAKELAALRKLTMRELRQRYSELFDAATNCNNRQWLVKRLIWRLQALAEGDLSERAKRRAAELANDADLRLSPPKPKEASTQESIRIAMVLVPAGERLPPPGSMICRRYRGEDHIVTVLSDGFEYRGDRFRSLSAVAKTITSQHVNGFAFFRLTKGVAS